MRRNTVTPHRPDRKASVDSILPKDVTIAAPIKISDSDNVPIQPDCRDTVIGYNGRATHIPDANFTGLQVSPKDVLFAVPIEIARVTKEVCRWRTWIWICWICRIYRIWWICWTRRVRNGLLKFACSADLGDSRYRGHAARINDK